MRAARMALRYVNKLIAYPVWGHATIDLDRLADLVVDESRDASRRVQMADVRLNRAEGAKLHLIGAGAECLG